MRLRTLLFALVVGCSPVLAFELNPLDVEAKATELNAQSIKLLGVSLNALRYLVNSSNDSYLLLWHLERSGDMKYIRELEAVGYVRVQVVEALPDGTQKAEKFVRLVPVGNGAELQRVLSLQHNSTAQPDARDESARAAGRGR